MESSKREAVIFIPPFIEEQKNLYLEDYLLLGLTTRLEGRQVELSREEVKIQGQSGKRLTYESIATGEIKTIDIYEAYWNDLIDPLSKKNAKDQAIKGIFLFIYWLFSGVWQMARKSRILLFQALIFLLLNVLWYYGSVVLALTSIGQNPSAFGLQLPSDLADQMAAIGRSLGGWKIWAATSFLLSLLPIPISSLVDLTDFTARYLQDETQAGIGGVRDRIRRRVEGILNDVIQEDAYERITVLAHSFGVIIGIDLLADYHPKVKKPIRFISMGGSVEFLSYRSSWVLEESARCLNNPALSHWGDYYSDQDWLCTKTPIPDGEQLNKFSSCKIKLRVPLARQIIGDSHNAYYFERPLLENLLDG